MPPTLDDLRRICAETTVPVNVLVAGDWTQHSHATLASVGVGRISLGSAFARTTYRTIVDTGRAILGNGDFTGMANALPGDEKDALLAKGSRS